MAISETRILDKMRDDETIVCMIHCSWC